MSLEVRPNPEDTAQRAVFTSVANYSPEEQKTEIELRFDDQLIETKALTLAPTNTTPVVFLASQLAKFITGVHRSQSRSWRYAAGDDLSSKPWTTFPERRLAAPHDP